MKIMRFFFACLAACFLFQVSLGAQTSGGSSAAPKFAGTHEENLIIPGQKVGRMTPGMTAEQIRKIYGSANLVPADLPAPEGATIEGAKLFPGTDRELELIWKDGDPNKVLVEVNVIGSAWVIEGGLKAGMTLLEVEKINGKPFKISGFDWDYGGYAVDFAGGAIHGLSLRFTYGDKQVDSSLIGDKTISSGDAKLRALNPKVEKPIMVHMMSSQKS